MSEIERLLGHQVREAQLRAASPDDGLAARITIDQVRRVQQIITDAVDGTATTEQLCAVEKFLTAVVIGSGHLRGHSPLDIEATWRELDRLPLERAQIDLTYPRPLGDERHPQ